MFTNREKEIFDLTSLTWVHKLEAEYFFRFAIDTGSLKITLRIYEQDIGGFTYVQSHFVKQPYTRSDINRASYTFDSPELALENAVDQITTAYDLAVKSGEQPRDWWFIANPDF